jgi:uncharacterized protein YjbI with pentapeptide repeats
VPTDDLRPPAPPRLPAQFEALDLASGVLVDEARLEDVALHGIVPPGTVARSAGIAGARVGGSLARARLPALHLRDAEVGVDLANLDAHKAELHRVVLGDCRLTGAQLVEASIRDVTFLRCRLDLAVLAGATLERVVLCDCVLNEASFEQALMRDVRFERCELAGATLTRLRLQRVVLTECRLSGLHDLGDLRGARMPWPDLVENAAALAGALGIEVLERE